jgi:hypothetical protein
MRLRLSAHGMTRPAPGQHGRAQACGGRARGVRALARSTAAVLSRPLRRAVAVSSLVSAGAALVLGTGVLSVAQAGTAQAATQPAPSWTQIVYRWTVISHGLSSSGTGNWNQYGWYDYRVSGAPDGVGLDQGSSTSNTWSGTLGVSISVLAATVGISASHSIDRTFSITYAGSWPNAKRNRYVGYTEYALTTQTFTVRQQKWECVQRANTNLCATHWPAKWEKVGTATVYVHEHSPTVRFYHCRRLPRIGQQCAANTG